MNWQDRFERLIFNFMAFDIKGPTLTKFKAVSKSELIAALEEVGGICKQAKDEGVGMEMILDTILGSSIEKLLECYINDAEISEVLNHVVRDTVIYVDEVKK